MEEALRLLILEDSQDDADLIVMRLKHEGFDVEWKRVETEAEFISALDPSLDLIIGDYSMPQYDGLRALEYLKDHGIEIPFILISGTMGEDLAVKAIKQGAVDYILKDRPARLGTAVRNALLEQKLLKEKLIAEKTSQRMEERLKVLYQVSQEIARVSLDLEQVYSAIHHAAEKLMPVEAFVISLFNENDNEYDAVYLIDKEGRWPKKRIPSGGGLTSYVSTSRKPLLINDFTPEHEIRAIHFGNSDYVRSIIAVPMVLGDKMIGMLSAQSYSQGAYTSEDQLLLEMLSAHAAVAIQNARFHTKIRQSEEQYRLITDNMSEMILYVNMDLKTIYASPSMLRLRGFSLDEINSMSFEQHLTPDSVKLVTQIIDENLTPEKLSKPNLKLSQTVELELYRKDGTTFWSEFIFVVTRDAKGKPEGILGVGRDITERKQAEQALRESEAKYRSLFENVLDGVCRTTPDGKVLAVNPALVKMLEYDSMEELLQTNAESDWWVNAHDREIWKRLLEETGELSSYEMRVKTKNKKELVILNNVQVHRNEQGEIDYYQGTLTDITARIQRQRELEAITAVGEALRTADTSVEVLPVILTQVMKLVNAKHTNFASLDPYTDEIILNLTSDIPHEPKEIRLRKGEGIIGKVFNTGETCVGEDVVHEIKNYLPGIVTGPAGGICIPLTSSGKVISVLWVIRENKFEADEIRILEAIADIAANALQRASLYEKTVLQLRQLTSFQAIDHAITGSMDLNVTLNVLLDQIITQLNIDAAAVMLFNNTSQTLEFSTGKGFPPDVLKKYRSRRVGGLASEASTSMEIIACELPGCPDDSFLAEAGYVMHIAVPLIAKGQVKGVLELFNREKLYINPEWRNFFETLASQAAISIDNATLFADVQRANIELSMSYDATIEGWSRALDLRDQETEGHTQRVVQMTLDLANYLGITGKELMNIRRGALLHDIGKMAIPDSILLKPGKLTESEWIIMKQHPVYAYKLLHPIPYLRQALDIPHCHHEKWDGSGYPRNLKGTQIPLAARIFAVVDVYDAITSDRPYRPALSQNEALEYIHSNSGTHFEPKVVEAFFRLIGGE